MMSRMPQSTLGVEQSGNSPWGCRKAAQLSWLCFPEMHLGTQRDKRH